MTTFIITIILIVFFVVFINKQKPKQKSAAFTEQRTIQFNMETVSNQTEEDSLEYAKWVKKYPKWYGSGNTRGVCFESERIEPLPNDQTELVRYKTDRYADLFGRGKDCSYFPGYGKIYNRIFYIWFQEFNSQEKKGMREYKDIGCDKYQEPFFTENFTNGISINNQLDRTKGYLKLFNIRDGKNRRTWYAGLKDLEFTGIITDSELDEKQNTT
ncbi:MULTISPECIES: hypothetical protein [unclassified Flavobacterium]|jgi:hypothetical protein|uniref:hypothetical protein n=1 Tax=unclassified Flavobacterium TaxID=196869 RepID=UPI0025B9DDAC|nr:MULTISPECIES: hypothetical protein [unclassified Flavobacterium]